MAAPHPGRLPAAPLSTTPAGRSIPVLPPLRDLLPGGGLRPGSVVSVTGSVSLMLALLAEASSTAWCAVCCLPALGAIAAAEMGVRLDHLVAVSVPPVGPPWPKVVSALLDGFDLVVVRPPHLATPRETRSLTARARERRTVLLVLGHWDGAELRVSAADPEWVGVDSGYGHLRGRAVTVRVAGRGAASRPRERRLWLPGPSGSAEPMEPGPNPDQGLGRVRVELLMPWGFDREPAASPDRKVVPGWSSGRSPLSGPFGWRPASGSWAVRSARSGPLDPAAGAGRPGTRRAGSPVPPPVRSPSSATPAPRPAAAWFPSHRPVSGLRSARLPPLGRVTKVLAVASGDPGRGWQGGGGGRCQSASADDDNAARRGLGAAQQAEDFRNRS